MLLLANERFTSSALNAESEEQDEPLLQEMRVPTKRKRSLKTGITLQIPRIVVTDSESEQSDWNEKHFYTPQPYRSPQPRLLSFEKTMFNNVPLMSP